MLSTAARAQAPAPADVGSPSDSAPAPAPAAPAPEPTAPAAPAAPASEPGVSVTQPTAGPDATPPAASTEPAASSPGTPSTASSTEPSAAPPAAQKPDKAADVPSVALLSLEANNAAAAEAAPGVASLIASRLAESPQLKVLTQKDIEAILGVERQRQLMGKGACSQVACLEEVSNITGARYIVTGRLDRFGDKYLLTVSLLDTAKGRSLAKPRAEASSPEELPQIADAIGEQLLVELAPSGKIAPGRPVFGSAEDTPGGGLVLGLRINNTFIDNLAALNPGADLELGYHFHPEWIAFLQVGITFVRKSEDGETSRLNVLPSVIGARHSYRMEQSFRPYWGLGLGVQLSFGQFGIFKSTGPLPTVIGFFGAEYVIADQLGIQIEAGTNLAQAILGLTDNGLGDGLNLDLAAGISYHF
jgi:TolB-like protein